MQIIVARKCDGNYDGVVDAADQTILNDALRDTSDASYVPLTAHGRQILDANLDGDINASDKGLLNRALMDPSAGRYLPLAWDVVTP